MANGAGVRVFSQREDARKNTFKQVWTQGLDDVFADVAKYQDRAHQLDSQGLWGWFRNRFLSTIELQGNQKALGGSLGFHKAVKKLAGLK